MNRRDLTPALMIAAGAALAVLGILLNGCATAPPPPPPVAPPSIFAPALDLDALLGPAPPPYKAPAGILRHDPVPLDEGNRYKLPPGILLDDADFGQMIADRAERDRLRTEARVLRDLRVHDQAAVLDAEQAYQKRLVELQTQNDQLRQPHPWERWLFIGGFVAGAAAAVLSTYAGTRASR